MAVLLLQSAYSLISSGGTFPESSHIDIIIRTSAAAIFGYFLSANFIRHSGSSRSEGANAPRQMDAPTGGRTSGGTALSRIGFASPDAPSTPETEDVDAAGSAPSGPEEAACLQVITSAGIGLFCLIVLILVRNFAPWDDTVNPSVTATVAQLRDFVSGSVGFLLGSPTSGTSSKP